MPDDWHTPGTTQELHSYCRLHVRNVRVVHWKPKDPAGREMQHQKLDFNFDLM